MDNSVPAQNGPWGPLPVGKGRAAASPTDFGGNMDFFDYCNYESDTFSDSSAPPPDFRVQRTPWNGHAGRAPDSSETILSSSPDRRHFYYYIGCIFNH